MVDGFTTPLDSPVCLSSPVSGHTELLAIDTQSTSSSEFLSPTSKAIWLEEAASGKALIPSHDLRGPLKYPSSNSSPLETSVKCLKAQRTLVFSEANPTIAQLKETCCTRSTQSKPHSHSTHLSLKASKGRRKKHVVVPSDFDSLLSSLPAGVAGQVLPPPTL